MSETYTIQGSTLESFGNEIREMQGTSNAMSPATMISHLEATNAQIASQSELIQEIKNVLSEKAGGIVMPELDNEGTANDLAQGVQLIDQNGYVVTGNIPVCNDDYGLEVDESLIGGYANDRFWFGSYVPEDCILRKNTRFFMDIFDSEIFGDAKPEDVAEGKTFTSSDGIKIVGTGTGVLGGGTSFTYPEGAFKQVTNFTDGKQYALVALIDGTYYYLNTTNRNSYTVGAIDIGVQTLDKYILFNGSPTLFTAVGTLNGFYLQNGSNYLCGTGSTNSTSLQINTTQTVWFVDDSDTGGFTDTGIYLPKENPNAVWLKSNNGSSNWDIKHEYDTNASPPYGFGYDQQGRNEQYAKDFVSIILYEYVGGETEGTINPIVDTSDATATSKDLLEGTVAYSNGVRLTGTMKVQTYYTGSGTPSNANGSDGDLYFVTG